MQQFEQSVKNASISVFCQTKFMIKVQTMDTKIKQAYVDLEKALKDSEAAQQQIGKYTHTHAVSLVVDVITHSAGQLQTAVEQANAAYQTAQQQNAENKQQINQLQGAVQQATNNAQAANEKYVTLLSLKKRKIEETDKERLIFNYRSAAMQQKVSEIQNAANQAKTELAETKKAHSDEVSKLHDQIANIKPEVHNHYYSDDGGSDCIIL